MTARGFPDWVRGDVAATGIAGRWPIPHEGETLPVEAGAYALAVFLDHLMTVDLPGRGSQRLAPGWHLYLGSARGPGGLSARIRRHFRRDRPMHWHIDRLTAAPAGIAALAVPGGNEWDLVATLLAYSRFRAAVAGFGSTDCRRCPGRLLIPNRRVGVS